jgi:cell division protein FtsL
VEAVQELVVVLMVVMEITLCFQQLLLLEVVQEVMELEEPQEQMGKTGDLAEEHPTEE